MVLGRAVGELTPILQTINKIIHALSLIGSKVTDVKSVLTAEPQPRQDPNVLGLTTVASRITILRSKEQQ